MRAADRRTTATLEGRAQVWDATTGALLSGHVFGGAMVRFTPDGSRLIGASEQRREVTCWDLATGLPVSWQTYGSYGRPRTIWMDGRPHPSKYAVHTRSGFTTGRWEGNSLVTYTTHMKTGQLRKTGPPISDEATMTTRYYRHGGILQYVLRSLLK